MKRAVTVALSFGFPAALAILFFFFLVAPARAPSGGKLWSGGRSIASLQELDFDRRLLKLQLCYGVRVVADQCSLERRRVCKALVVHELETALDATGKYLRAPVAFRCEDTAVGRAVLDDEVSVSLRPNNEVNSIQSVLQMNLKQGTLDAAAQRKVMESCEFLTDCKWAMRPATLSLRKLASCLTTGNAAHRKVLMSEAGAMLFAGKAGRRNTLYPRFEASQGGK